jgi:hypothetical protein
LVTLSVRQGAYFLAHLLPTRANPWFADPLMVAMMGGAVLRNLPLILGRLNAQLTPSRRKYTPAAQRTRRGNLDGIGWFTSTGCSNRRPDKIICGCLSVQSLAW